MWTCPECGRSFANRNQSHFCSHVRLEDHFKGREPDVVATFERLLEAAAKSGPSRSQALSLRFVQPSRLGSDALPGPAVILQKGSSLRVP